MITIICGEDTSSSRHYYADKINGFKEKGLSVENLTPDQLKSLKGGFIDKTLFGSTTAYVCQNAVKFYSRKKKDLNDLLNNLSKEKDLILLLWEGGLSKRNLGITSNIVYKEFRPEKNIFKLLESCYPKNINQFIFTLNSIKNKNNDFFVLLMLIRHIKKLILYQLGDKPKNLQMWQENKLNYQQKYWDKDKLLAYYDKLIQIDPLIKRGSSPYNIFKYIEIVSSYYL
ncbi:MAG: hypothetical protein ABH812_03915 [bacterium]